VISRVFISVLDSKVYPHVVFHLSFVTAIKSSLIIDLFIVTISDQIRSTSEILHLSRQQPFPEPRCSNFSLFPSNPRLRRSVSPFVVPVRPPQIVFSRRLTIQQHTQEQITHNRSTLDKGDKGLNPCFRMAFNGWKNLCLALCGISLESLPDSL